MIKEKILERTSKIVAFFLLVMGVVGFIVALNTLKVGTFSKPQAGFAPLLFSSLLIVFSIINLVFEFLKPNSIPGEMGKVNWKKFFLYMLICAVYVFFVKRLGFMTSTFLCLVAMIKLADLKGWLKPVCYSFIFSVLVWLLFTKAMDVPLPRGFLI